MRTAKIGADLRLGKYALVEWSSCRDLDFMGDEPGIIFETGKGDCCKNLQNRI